MKKVLVTGLCTLHWGRLQYGNIGNYYIVEPLFRLLHKYFKEYEIVTTFQMDDEFIEKENIKVLPMDIYYSWSEDDVEKAELDVEVANNIVKGIACRETLFIKELKECEYVINVSGDMWGDNAEHVGHNRFLVDCLKMKAAQILNKKTILYAATPGPFSDNLTKLLAKEVFETFSLVLIREKVSMNNLKKWGIATDNVMWAPCPSFLFEPNQKYHSKWTEYIDSAHQSGCKVIGMTFGGFNMPVGPYDMLLREDKQYDNFVGVAKYVLDIMKSNIILFSHTNGFDLPPDFKLKNGRDYFILEQFYHILMKENPDYKDKVVLIDEPLLPSNIKRVIGSLDMLITGRVHASVAATSQYIPTVYIEYDSNVIYSDKMTGFSSQIMMEEYVCNPQNFNQMIEKTKACYENLDEVHKKLETVIPTIKNKSENIFETIRNV